MGKIVLEASLAKANSKSMAKIELTAAKGRDAAAVIIFAQLSHRGSNRARTNQARAILYSLVKIKKAAANIKMMKSTSNTSNL